MKKQKTYTDKELMYIAIKYCKEINGATRALYACMPWTFMTVFQTVMDYITNPEIKIVFDADKDKLTNPELYNKYIFFRNLTNEGTTVQNMLLQILDCKEPTNFVKKRIKSLRNLEKKVTMDNFVFYTKIYGVEQQTYEELKQRYRDSSNKKLLKQEFLRYIKYTNVDQQRKQSKRYTVSRDLDKDVYYETTEGRLARIKRYLYKKYLKQGKIDTNLKAYCAIPEGTYVKPMRLINKVIPKANENMKLIIAGLFEGIKDCHMVIDTDFRKAYNPYYNTHQDTDGDKASNYSCMSGYGEQAQAFYGLIHGCKVVRWETNDGEQIGRCIMYEWKGRRHFIRIYGQYDYHRTMINMLEAQMKEGDLFGRNKCIDDIRLETDMTNNTSAMYLDGNNYGLSTDGDNWWVVANNYDNDCKTTGGESLALLNEDYCTCEQCGRSRYNEDGIRIDNSFYCCDECAEEAGYRCCEHCGEWVHEDDAIYVDGAGYYCCRDCAERAGYGYDTYYEEWTDDDDLGETDDRRYITTKSGAAEYYEVDEDDVEWDSDNGCWKRPEQEQQTEGEEND